MEVWVEPMGLEVFLRVAVLKTHRLFQIYLAGDLALLP